MVFGGSNPVRTSSSAATWISVANLLDIPWGAHLADVPLHDGGQMQKALSRRQGGYGARQLQSVRCPSGANRWRPLGKPDKVSPRTGFGRSTLKPRSRQGYVLCPFAALPDRGALIDGIRRLIRFSCTRWPSLRRRHVIRWPTGHCRGRRPERLTDTEEGRSRSAGRSSI